MKRTANLVFGGRKAGLAVCTAACSVGAFAEDLIAKEGAFSAGK